MSSSLIDTTFGTLIRRLLTNNSVKHPEEKSDFDLSYATSTWQCLSSGSSVRNSESSREPGDAPDNGLEFESNHDDTPSTTGHRVDADFPDQNTEQISNYDSLETVIVDWYGRDDPANPINWSKRKKAIVFFVINYTTFTVYMASAIYTPAQDDVQKVFGLSTTVASLGLAIFVLGYGTGSLVFAPLSEIPSVGRNAPYLITLVIFIIISAPTALSSNFAAMMVLRFLQGFFGSPILSTGGASLSDISDTRARPFALYTWAVFAFTGPSVGAVMAGYSIPHLGWRWSLWEIMICVGPAVILHLFLPETSAQTILFRRAVRLRQATGKNCYQAQSELDAADVTAKDRLYRFLVMPWRINLLDPSILFTSIYAGLLYAIFNSLFEFFPLVYGPIYGMSKGQTGLVLLSNAVAVTIAAVPYFIYITVGVNAPSQAGKQLSPESRLLPALFASVFIPAGIFLFGWASRPNMHWIVPTIGIVFATGGFAIVLQSIFVYMGLSYPDHAASLFAGNAFAKAVIAFGGVLWAHPLYDSLGLAKGMSLLGALCAVFVSGVFVLYIFGERLRKRSRFAM